MDSHKLKLMSHNELIVLTEEVIEEIAASYFEGLDLHDYKLCCFIFIEEDNTISILLDSNKQLENINAYIDEKNYTYTKLQV